MEMQKEFDFESLLPDTAPACRGQNLNGLTVGVYSTSVTLSPDLLEALGMPKGVSVEYSRKLNAIVFSPDPEGYPVVITDRRRRLANSTQLSKKLAGILGYDREKKYCRMVNGVKRPSGVCFWVESRELLDVTKRSGK